MGLTRSSNRSGCAPLCLLLPLFVCRLIYESKLKETEKQRDQNRGVLSSLNQLIFLPS